MYTLPESKSCQYLVQEHIRTILERYPDNLQLGYKARHRAAWFRPRNARERSIAGLITAFAELADSYMIETEGERCIGDDGYFYEHAEDMIKAMHALLNFDCGRFDCGTLSALIHQMAEMAGIDDE